MGRDNNSSDSKVSILKSSIFRDKSSRISSAGFTLIELITAIGVFTVLASMVLLVINPVEQLRKAQDSKRKTGFAQVQRALESYYQDYGRYPSYTTAGQYTYTINKGSGEDENKVIWGTTWAPYIDVLPIDPNSSKYYLYWSDSSNGYQSYRLYTSLDRGSKDPDACSDAVNGCSGVPANGDCGINQTICSYGVTSPNISP